MLGRVAGCYYPPPPAQPGPPPSSVDPWNLNNSNGPAPLPHFFFQKQRVRVLHLNHHFRSLGPLLSPVNLAPPLEQLSFLPPVAQTLPSLTTLSQLCTVVLAMPPRVVCRHSPNKKKTPKFQRSTDGFPSFGGLHSPRPPPLLWGRWVPGFCPRSFWTHLYLFFRVFNHLSFFESYSGPALFTSFNSPPPFFFYGVPL